MGTVVTALVVGQLECGPSGEPIVCRTTDTKLSLEVRLLPTVTTLFLILTLGEVQAASALGNSRVCVLRRQRLRSEVAQDSPLLPSAAAAACGQHLRPPMRGRFRTWSAAHRRLLQNPLLLAGSF